MLYVCSDLNVSNLHITSCDIRAANNRVKPTALREILVDVPKVKWSDIGGQNLVKQRLQEAVELPLKVGGVVFITIFHSLNVSCI